LYQNTLNRFKELVRYSAMELNPSVTRWNVLGTRTLCRPYTDTLKTFW